MYGRFASIVFVPLVTLALASGCKESGTFAGGGQVSKRQEKEEATTDISSKPPRETDDATSGGDGRSRFDPSTFKDLVEDDEGDVDPMFDSAASTNDNAVFEGSFAAWTEPANPVPTQSYWIHIEVRLPSGVSTYSVNDLAGFVTGTDQYKRGLGRESRGPYDPRFSPPFLADDPIHSNPANFPRDQFQFNGKTARIAVWVPGALAMVQDVIDIKSDLLNERATLTIIFQ